MGNIFDCAQNPLNMPSEGGEDGLGDAASKMATLQGPTRLMDSMVWGLQQAFYMKMGVSAWSDAVVPNFVTSNRCAGQLCNRRVVCREIRSCYAASMVSDCIRML